MVAVTSQVRTFAVVWAAYAGFILVLALGLWIPSGLATKMDFRAMYAAGFLARTDPSHLYDLGRQKQIEDVFASPQRDVLPFGHLPHEAILFAPFSRLPYRAAYLAMLLFNVALIGACFWVARKEFSAIQPLWQPRAGLIFFSFLPTAFVLAQGQDSFLLLLLICVAWRMLERSRCFAAGAVLSLMLFKPHVVLILGFLLTVRFGRRFLMGFLAGSVLVAGLCWSVIQGGVPRALIGILWRTSLAGHYARANQDAVGVYPTAMPNLRGLLFFSAESWIQPHLFLGVLGVLSLLVLGWSVWKIRRQSPGPAFALSVITSVLLSYHFQAADLVVLLLPFMLLDAGETQLESVCRNAILLLPVPIVIFASRTVPGAPFCILCIPLLVLAFEIGNRRAPRTQCDVFLLP